MQASLDHWRFGDCSGNVFHHDCPSLIFFTIHFTVNKKVPVLMFANFFLHMIFYVPDIIGISRFLFHNFELCYKQYFLMLGLNVFIS